MSFRAAADYSWVALKVKFAEEVRGISPVDAFDVLHSDDYISEIIPPPLQRAFIMYLFMS